MKSFIQYISLPEAKAVVGGKVHRFIKYNGAGMPIDGKKYKGPVELETLKIDNGAKTVTFRVIAPKKIFGKEVEIPMKALRMGPFVKLEIPNAFEQMSEAPNKIICGECFSWAFRETVDGWEKGKKWILVHGTVTEPFKEPANKYNHAWVDKGSKIEDWQNMKAGIGGKFSGKGYPKKVFKEIYKPEKLKLYKSMDDIAKAWKKDKTPGIHYGPWS